MSRNPDGDSADMYDAPECPVCHSNPASDVEQFCGDFYYKPCAECKAKQDAEEDND